MEFQLCPHGNVDDFLGLFRAAKAYLEQETETTNLVRLYAAGYVRAGRLERFATPVLRAPPVRDNGDDDLYDLPPLLDN